MVKPLSQIMQPLSFIQTIVKVGLTLSFILLLSGCQEDTLLSLEVTDQVFAFESFETADILAQLIYDSGEQSLTLEESFFDEASLEKLSRPGHHDVDISYEGLKTSFKIVLLDDAVSMQQSNIYTLGLESGMIVSDYETWLASIEGDEGLGIADLYINETGELVVVYTDETFVNLGNVIGKDAEPVSFNVSGSQLLVTQGDLSEALFDLSTLKGNDGISISNLRFNENDELVVAYSDATTSNLGSFTDFLETLAIENVYTNQASELIIVLTDGRSFNVGSVLGPVGPTGERGLQGLQGPQGVKGDPGSQGESPEFRLDGVMMQYKYPSEDMTAWRDLFNFQTLESETFTFVTRPGIVLRVNESSNALEWKPDESPDSAYQVLYTADNLRGETGRQGEALEIRYNETLDQIETKYASDTTWTLLASKDVFLGPQGDSVTLTVSSGAIYWAVDDNQFNYQKLIDLSALEAPPARIIVSGAALYNQTSSTASFIVSLSALQGPMGATGRGISEVAIVNDEWLITYDDGHLQNLGTLASTYQVSFRLNGFIYDIQTIRSGSDAAIPDTIPVPYGTTISGFSSSLTNITQDTVIDTVLDYDVFTLTIDGSKLVTFTALEGLHLPVPEVIPGFDFVKYYSYINNQSVQIYDGFALDVLFKEVRTKDVFTEYKRTTVFTNQSEEARIAMIDYILGGLISITNNASDGTYFGSGAIINKQENGALFDYIGVTNYHVIENYNTVDVSVFIGGNEYIITNVTVLGSDPKNDVAVLSFSSSLELNALNFANSMTIQTSQTVYSLGNPLGLEYFNSVTEGILISDKRFFADGIYESYYIQHSSAINPGNSGGPLIDSNGKILGLNTLKILTSNDVNVESFGFAIPSLIVERVLLDVLNGTSLDRGTLGITAEALPTTCDTRELKGICIDSVAPNSAAFNMGLQSGDIIIYYKTSRLEDFFEVKNLDELLEATFLTRRNELVTIGFIRNGERLTTSSQTLD